MSELKELLEKVKLENIMAFMIYGMDSGRDAFENYEREIEKSYDEIFYGLEHLYSEADRKDDKLFDVVADFAMLHDDIYFEAGVLIGFQLFKTMEYGYQEHEKDSIMESVSNGNRESVLKQIVRNRIDTALEETLRTDKEYQEMNKNFHETMRRVDRNKFSIEQWEIVDEALSACNERSAEYGKMAYQQGVSDVVNLLKDIFVSV